MMVNIPNALTLLRALGVPAFLYLLLIADQPIFAFLVIALGGLTDYLDGKIARALKQTTEFGAKFDPVVDRLYITAVILALANKDYLPWSLVIALIARDLLLAVVVLLQRLKGRDYIEVSFLGKAATFNLLYAFPLLLLSAVDLIGNVAFVMGWAFAIWGVTLYFYTGLQYLFNAIRSFR
jgi:cardiolipin synthase